MFNWFTDYPILVTYQRNGVTENTIKGVVSVVTGRGRKVATLGRDITCYGRSLMKPFYLEVFHQELEQALNDSQQAIALSSHSGTSEQVAAAKSILDPQEEKWLQVPPSLPLLAQWPSDISQPTKWIHNSSGHHAAMIKGCLMKGWNAADYTSCDHLVFQSYQKIMGALLDKNLDAYHRGTDGDGLPTVAMSVSEMARIYAAFSLQNNWRVSAFWKHPDLIGGSSRLDTRILKAASGKVIAKEGADGLLGLAIVDPQKYPEGLGVVIKVAHGWDPQATSYVAQSVLKQLGIEWDIDAPVPPAGQTVHINKAVTRLLA